MFFIYLQSKRMNFNRLNYDSCTYQHNLQQSVNVGNYVIGMPQINCNACFTEDTSLQLGYSPAVVPYDNVVDIDSDLIGITRKASNCPTKSYIPDLTRNDKTRYNMTPIADCRYIKNEDTRISNPPCTLRGQGWNRWETLHENPQDRAEVPFRFNVNNRILFKDNHRPFINKLINQSPLLPPMNQSDEVIEYNNKESICYGKNIDDGIKRVQFWGSCDELSKVI